MPGGKKKGKKGKNAPAEPYDGFSAPVSLLQSRFKQNAVQAGLDAVTMAPVMQMFNKVLEEEGNEVKSMKQIVLGEPLAEECVDELCKTFKQLYYTKVRSICLWNTEMGDKACSEICSSIIYFEHLHKLDLRDCGLGLGGCRALASALRTYRNPDLRVISLSHNGFGDEGLKILKRALKLQTRLKTLDLSFCQLKIEAGDHLSDMLCCGLCRLETLNLEGNELRGEGLMKLCKGLRKNKTLQTLNLANNMFGGDTDMESLVELAQAIHENPFMSRVDLDGNLIQEEGANMCVQTIEASPHIQSLVVTHRMAKESFNAVSEALSKNCTTKKKGGKKGGKKGKKKK